MIEKIGVLRETIEMATVIIGKADDLFEKSSRIPLPTLEVSEIRKEIDQYRIHLDSIFKPENIMED